MVTPLAVETSLVDSGADFDAWMASEQRRIFVLCYRMLNDRDEADTATQDVFLKAHRALSHQTFPNAEEMAKWVTRIAVNTCLDRLRSARWTFWKRRVARPAEEAILNTAESSRPGAEARVFAGEVEKRLAAALNRLSDRQRAVFTLRHYEDRSLEEIAAILNVDAGSVKSHMFRAIAKLRDELQDLYVMGRKS